MAPHRFTPAACPARGDRRLLRGADTLLCALLLLAGAPGRGAQQDDEGVAVRLPLPPEGDRKPPVSGMRFVVEVGRGRISLDQVLEIWGPSWYRLTAAARQGRISAGECDRRLQDEWGKALRTMIREEVFYQEAVRAFNRDLERMVDRVYEARQHTRGSSPSRLEVEREIRSSMQRDLQRAVKRMIERFLRSAGGVERFKRVLRARGLTWEEWRRRLLRKGMVQRHLYMVLTPLVPRTDLESPAEVRGYFRAHADEFRRPGRVVFRHILFSYAARGGEDAARLAARNVYEAIERGDIGFEQAARKHSDDAVSRARGGLENGVDDDPDREAWLADVREAVRDEKPGELGPILVSGTGCHLVMLVRKYPDIPIPFRRAQEMISERMHATRWNAAADKYYRELRAKVRVKILRPRFPSELSFRELRRRERRAPPLIHLDPGALPRQDRVGR